MFYIPLFGPFKQVKNIAFTRMEITDDYFSMSNSRKEGLHHQQKRSHVDVIDHSNESDDFGKSIQLVFKKIRLRFA